MNGPASAMLSTPKARAIVWQALVLVLLAAAGLWLVSNLLTNLEIRRIGSGFGFLERPTGMPIGEKLIAYAPGDSNLRAIIVGLLNTMVVSVVGIVLATVVGAAVGIARLSKNWLLARAASAYVEFVRNVPLLAHLFVIYALLQGLPPIRSAWSVGDVIFLSNRGLFIPAIELHGSWLPAVVAALSAIAAVAAINRYARNRQERTGLRPRVLGVSIAILAGLPAAILIAQNATFSLDLPRLSGFNFAGGLSISPELTALTAGLVIYFAAFIAEIVRGGILAVSQGQWDAGFALGLHRPRVLRLVVLPQAMRLIIPATTNQYLDLAKSSSLAIAIGYPDLVAVINGIITDTGQAVELVAIIMAAFLLMNLAIAALMNWYNARMRLVEH